MAGGNLTPRQKMINMMYLVLTAMLALNVSAEVLNAFALVDKGLNQSISTVRERNTADLDDFEKAMANNYDKVAPWKAKADSVHTKTNALYNRIQDIKISIIRKGDGIKAKSIGENSAIDVDMIEAVDNTDAAHNIMLGSSDTRSGEAYALREEINKYKQYLLTEIDPKANASRSIETGLLLKDPPMTGDGTNRTWETSQFDAMPLISAVALLSKLQLDVVSCESEAINWFRSRIDASDYKFSSIKPMINAHSNYVIKGTDYTAEIFLGAYDPTQKPILYINGRSYSANEKGKIEFKYTPGAVGPQRLPGTVEFMGPDGPEKEAIALEFMVGEPNVVVSPTKMNVVYRGIDNPLNVSMSGVAPERLQVKASNGTITQHGKECVLRPGEGRTCDVSVLLDGTQQMGTVSFRVKSLPTPAGAVFGVTGKTVNKNELAAAEGVIAEMKDFDFDLKYKVTSFKVSATINGYEEDAVAQSELMTDKQKQLISRTKSGQKVIFSEIKATGPGGQIELYDFVLKIR
jgi:gliding motility-associated protein GldM